MSFSLRSGKFLVFSGLKHNFYTDLEGFLMIFYTWTKTFIHSVEFFIHEKNIYIFPYHEKIVYEGGYLRSILRGGVMN